MKSFFQIISKYYQEKQLFVYSILEAMDDKSSPEWKSEEEYINIDVGGEVFTTTKETVTTPVVAIPVVAIPVVAIPVAVLHEH